MKKYILIFPVLNGIPILADSDVEAMKKAESYIAQNHNIGGGMLYDMQGKLIFTN